MPCRPGGLLKQPEGVAFLLWIRKIWPWKTRRIARRDAEEIVIRWDEVYEGALRATGVLRIEGKVRGTIDAKGDVIIGENALVLAEVSAVNLIVAGELHGKVDIPGRLHILPGGKFSGDARVGVFVAEDGAAFCGDCTVEVRRPGQRSEHITRRIETTAPAATTGQRAGEPVGTPDSYQAIRPSPGGSQDLPCNLI